MAEQPIYSPPKAIVREREVPARVRGRYPHSHRERTDGRRSDRREEVPRDSYHIEKNYRAYGHQGDRRNVATSSRAIPVSEPYERGYEHRVLDPRYRSVVPAHVESLRMDPLYLDGREHHNYTRVVSDHTEDPYAYPYDASPRDAYLTPLGREDIASSSYLVRGRPYVETDSMRRRETLPDRHYSIYSAADALPEYDRMQPYHGGRLDVSPVRVASHYSFAGRPYSRR